MTLRITGIKDAGDSLKERVVLQADEAVAVGDYLLLCVAAQDGQPTTDVQKAFWFPDLVAEEGDLVVLYTKGGREKQRARRSGGTNHFHYWGLDDALWEGNVTVAVLINALDWTAFAPDAGDEG